MKGGNGMLTQARLKEVVHYDPDIGVFTWLTRVVREEWNRTDRSWNGRYAGKRAGSLSVHLGYRILGIDDHAQYEHRLAWLYMTGEWPAEYIDHINLIKSDNRWGNLRAASRSQNKANVPLGLKNTSGYKGVCYSPRHEKWKAQIQVDRRNRHLGLFNTPEDAHAAYCFAAKSHFGEFSRVS